MKGENLMAHNPPKEVTPPEAEQSAPAPVPSINKPSAFSLNKFKSTRVTSAAGLDNLVDPLPILKVGEVKDFFRVHPDEENYWSSELCFVSVPIKGMKKDLLHLIVEELAMQFLPTGRILRFRVALASKPFDILFFVHVPSVNMDNTWNITALSACEQAKTLWTSAVSRKDEGSEGYKVDSSKSLDAFPDPRWPNQSLEDLIGRAFAGRIIDVADHPSLLRLIGAKQSLS
jgi:hypothetical protein